MWPIHCKTLSHEQIFRKPKLMEYPTAAQWKYGTGCKKKSLKEISKENYEEIFNPNKQENNKSKLEFSVHSNLLIEKYSQIPMWHHTIVFKFCFRDLPNKMQQNKLILIFCFCLHILAAFPHHSTCFFLNQNLLDSRTLWENMPTLGIYFFYWVLFFASHYFPCK